MAFKGTIPNGSKVEVELQLANTAAGSAMLGIGFAGNNGKAGSDAVVVAPGGSAKAAVTTGPQGTGVLDVTVDFSSEADSGRLTVLVNGAMHTSDTGKGDTKWTFALI